MSFKAIYPTLTRPGFQLACKRLIQGSFKTRKWSNSSLCGAFGLRGQYKRTLDKCVYHTFTRGMLTHTDDEGKASMVDVSAKTPSRREATAVATVSLTKFAFELVKQNQIKKGDVLSVATIAGIMGAKECHRMIPLCHSIALTNVHMNFTLNEADCAINIKGTAISVGQTGVEMEALSAVSVAALTVYDMCKGVTQDIVIGNIKLVEKKGGKTGHYIREENLTRDT